MVAINFLWNPLNDNIVREFDDAGAAVAEYDTQSDDFGNVVSQRRSGTDSYFHYDGIGCALALSNQIAAVTDSRAYAAFGETTEQSGVTVLPFTYVGRSGYYLDDELAEHSVRRRVYQPHRARWSSVDPIGPEGVIQPYVYASNRPVVYRDPSGMNFILVDAVIEVVCICRNGLTGTLRGHCLFATQLHALACRQWVEGISLITCNTACAHPLATFFGFAVGVAMYSGLQASQAANPCDPCKLCIWVIVG